MSFQLEPSTVGGHYLLRVIVAVASPYSPGEIGELACCDAVIDDSGPGVGEPRRRIFGTAVNRSHRTCSPADLAQLIWEFATPDVLVAHDASKTALTFGPAITANLPWISLHKVARTLWPAAPDGNYSLAALCRWRAKVGRTDALCGVPATGAAREAHLVAWLLAEILSEPSLRAAGQPMDCGEVERDQRLGDVLADMFRRDGVQTALRISSLQGPPLEDHPFSWEGVEAWRAVGLDDLRWIVRAGPSEYAAHARAAARAELGRRARTAIGGAPRRIPLVLRRLAWPEGSGGTWVSE